MLISPSSKTSSDVLKSPISPPHHPLDTVLRDKYWTRCKNLKSCYFFLHVLFASKFKADYQLRIGIVGLMYYAAMFNILWGQVHCVYFHEGEKKS